MNLNLGVALLLFKGFYCIKLKTARVNVNMLQVHNEALLSHRLDSIQGPFLIKTVSRLRSTVPTE